MTPYPQRVCGHVSRNLQKCLTGLLAALSITVLGAETAQRPANETNTLSLYFPVHMPGLELTVPEENGAYFDLGKRF